MISVIASRKLNRPWAQAHLRPGRVALFTVLVIFSAGEKADAQSMGQNPPQNQPGATDIVQPKPEDDPFKSSAIPQNMFREGEVARFERAYGDWRLVCDEIIRTKQRFCSAYSQLKNNGKFSRLNTVISTSDSGNPAAIIYFPLGSYLPRGIEITIKDSKEKMKVNFVQCDAKFCSTIFPLKGKILASLLAGQSVSVNFSLIVGDTLRFTKSLSDSASRLSLEWSGTGLANALQNSVK